MSSDTSNVEIVLAVLIAVFVFALYASPWYTIIMHKCGREYTEDKLDFAYTTAKMEVWATVSVITVYYFNRLTIPWYIFEQADPVELGLCGIMSLVGGFVIVCAYRAEKMHTNERWFVILAILCILTLAWCETLIPWTH